jgi:hypothetical protein
MTAGTVTLFGLRPLLAMAWAYHNADLASNRYATAVRWERALLRQASAFGERVFALARVAREDLLRVVAGADQVVVRGIAAHCLALCFASTARMKSNFRLGCGCCARFLSRLLLHS